MKTVAIAKTPFVRVLGRSLEGLVAAAHIVGTAAPADAEAVACKREIARAAAKYGSAKLNALRKCEDAVLTGKITGPCPDAKASSALTKAATKLQSSIAKRCGGTDKNCATTGDNDTLASIGWNLGSCPNFESGGCTNTLSHCGDVTTCVRCINDAAVDQAIDLYYDDLAPTGDTVVKKCQRTIGKETAKFFDAKRKALGKCKEAVLTSGAGTCPDAKATTAIDKAEAKKVAKICGACGGTDKACGGPDDLTVAQIGFPASCPNVDPPGATAPCGGAVSSLTQLVDCVDCVTGFKADCVGAAGAPAAGAYPPECSGGGTPTPTPTATPSNCGNSTVDPGEECDGSDDASCPGECTPDCFCGEACALPNPMPVTIALAARPGVDLDTGWTGVSHDLPGVDDAPTTSARLSSCDTNLSSPTCGQCNVNGPIEYQGPANTCRCYNATTPDASTLTSCDPEAPACGGGQICQCFYGPPLPLSSGAVPVCVVNRFSGTFAGTLNVANAGTHAGEGASQVQLLSSVFNGLGATNPCPKCDNDVTARDGLAQGTCNGGPKHGQSCDTAGVNVYFGTTSLDCPPATAANIGDLRVNFKPATTGTTSLGTARPCTGGGGGNCYCNTCPTAASEPCNTNADCPGNLPCGGRRCLGGPNAGAPCGPAGATSECPSSSCAVPGTPTARSACTGNPCESNPSDPSGPTEGVCPDGPVDANCSLEPFRGCVDDADCNPPPAGNCSGCVPDQTCQAAPRQCFLDPIVRTGTPGTRDSVIVATFCLPPTRGASINSVAGLPGPGAVRQPTRTFRIGPLCGNGAIDTGETCDGGNDVACPGACGLDCQCPAAATCGDGEVNQPSEECDGADDNACPGLCQGGCTCAAFCGDGDVNQPSEACDDGNQTNGDACDNNCTLPTCGNGIRAGAEQCDGGDAHACNGSTCKPDCTCNPFCGDNVQHPPAEECDGTDHGACGLPPGTGTCELDCTCADFCGNDIREGAESCDGSDASACPGECGGDCTCPKIGSLTLSTLPGADLDTGWSGSSHNFSIQTCAEIAGDLGGCNPALGDNDCTFFANVGSFCSGNPAISCTDNTQCVGNGSCVITPYGSPLPLSSGGVPVCILNRFSGDVTGSYNLVTGAASLTVPLNSIVTLATDSNVPCPTCDCASPPCQCGDTGTCSSNPLQNCTVGGIGPFGPTSNDCQPTGPNVSGGGLNIAFAPATTATSTFPSNTPCTGSGYTQYGCWIAGESQPSACLKGCNGGANDGQDCTVDGDCPGGIGPHPCQPLCRHDDTLDPGAAGANEARCVLGPVDKTCAQAHQITCTQDSDCIGTGPCVTEVRRCFIDPIVRTGVPGTATLTLASTFPIPATSSPAVNNTAGLPGPGAIRYPQSVSAAYCGDDQLNQASEECDGTADLNCPGACNDAACVCNVVCGNDTVDFGEQCDGTANAACNPPAGSCVAPGMPNECTCTPAICGDGFKAASEQCDPGAPPSTPADDAACPGECQAALCTCPPPVCGDGVIEGTEVCELPAVGCGALQVCAACTGCLP